VVASSQLLSSEPQCTAVCVVVTYQYAIYSLAHLVYVTIPTTLPTLLPHSLGPDSRSALAPLSQRSETEVLSPFLALAVAILFVEFFDRVET
jgi:hypothetical protein